MKILSFVTPAHSHECTDCTFKGTVKIGRGKTAMVTDIYTCGDDVIARYGSELSECITRSTTNLNGDIVGDAAATMLAMNGKPEKWTRDLIRERLAINDAWVKRGVVSIFNLQTESEQDSECTAEDNGVGFSGVDAELLSSFAKQLITRGSLSPKQMEWARKKMLKYAGQLAKIANGEITA